MISAQSLSRLQKTRAKGLGRLLLLSRRAFLSRLKKEMADDGGVPFSRSSGALLPFIDLEGTRSGDVARRAGISKQAAAKGIKELEDAGLLTRSVDAQDARAARVQFTERGIQYLLDMHDAISRIEASYEAQVGTAAMEGLRSTLQALIAFETQKE